MKFEKPISVFVCILLCWSIFGHIVATPKQPKTFGCVDNKSVDVEEKYVITEIESVPGIAYVFFELSKFDSKYKEYYEKGFHWTLSVAEPTPGGGYKWPVYQGAKEYNHYMNALVGRYLLHVHNETGNTTYMKYIKGLAKWLIDEAEPSGGGYRWSQHEGDKKYLVSGQAPASIGLFFLELWQITKNDTCKKYAVGLAEYLKSQAVKVGENYTWPQREDKKIYQEGGLCRSVPGTVEFFYLMYLAFNDTSYLEYANKGLNWLISVAEKENNGYKWQFYKGNETWYKTGRGKGTAGVGKMFLLGHKITGNTTYLEYAEGAARWLIHKAVNISNGYKWQDRIGLDEYTTHWCQGTGGISEFFAELWHLTKNHTYKKYCEGQINWYDTIKIKDMGKHKWNAIYDIKKYIFYTGGYGQAGIAHFMMNVCTILNTSKYLSLVKGVMDWVAIQKVEEFNGYKWPTRVSTDLYMSENNISFSNLTPKEGDTIYINATLWNKGVGNAVNVSVQFFDGHPSNNIKIGSALVDSIGTFKEEKVSVKWNIPMGQSGVHEIYVLVDYPDDFVHEFNETNNVGIKKIKVSVIPEINTIIIPVVGLCISAIVVSYIIVKRKRMKKKSE